jgi:hypothetical protein
MFAGADAGGWGTMDIDIDTSLRWLRAGLGALPAAIAAIALLAGPTALWLLYRFLVQPRNARYQGEEIGPLWICAGCHSANQLAFADCYRCGREIDEWQLQVFDPGSDELITFRPPAVRVGPGRPERHAEPRREIAATGHAVAVGPGRAKAGVGKPDVGPVEAMRGAVGPGKARVRSAAVGPGITEPDPANGIAGTRAPKVDRPRRAVMAGGTTTKRPGGTTPKRPGGTTPKRPGGTTPKRPGSGTGAT